MSAARTNWNLQANRLGDALARHRASGRPLLDLTASNPTTCGFQYDADAILRALASPASLVYEPQPQGLDIARKAVADYYAERGDHLALDDMILTTSTSEAYSFVFRLLCNPGEEILIPAPSYPLFDFLADLEDVKLVRYPLIYDYGWQIDLAGLEQAITPQTRALIVVNPNNPTGHFCAPPQADRVNEICSQREMAVIADEVFLDFSLDETSARSFVANDEVLTFTLSGLSKISGLPQMKLAWLVVSGPRDLKSDALARLNVIADTYLSMNAPIQHAAPVLLAQRHAFREQLMKRVRGNLTELDAQLAAQNPCSRLELQGGWYAVVRVPRTLPDEDLAIELLTSHCVYVHPGHFYDFPSDGYLVLSLITSEEQLAEGLRRLLGVFT
jgi:alanine-synthesizing transaminase